MNPRLLSCLVMSLGLIASACGGTSAALQPASEGTNQAAGSESNATPAVSVEAASTGTSQAELQAPAVLHLDETRTARIGAIVDAVVADLRVNVGDRVTKGTILGTLHSHSLHDVVAEYRKAQAEQRQHETELTYATNAEERAKRLLAARAVSQQEVARATADRVSAEEALTIARTEVQRARDELEHLGVDVLEVDAPTAVDRLPIRSPIDGVVLERLVTPGAAVVPGTPLFVVSDLRQLWAVAEVDERHLPRLAARQPVTLEVAAYPATPFEAQVLAIGEVVHPSTRRVSVRIAVPNGAGRLKPQMFATVRLGVDDQKTVVTVPKAALQTLGEQTVVFVQTGEGTFEPRPVSVLAERDNTAHLESGLLAGERVATSGSFLLKSAHTATPE